MQASAALNRERFDHFADGKFWAIGTDLIDRHLLKTALPLGLCASQI
jgi:hypothetical protein